LYVLYIVYQYNSVNYEESFCCDMMPVFHLNQLNMDSNEFYESIFIGESLEYMNHILQNLESAEWEGSYREYIEKPPCGRGSSAACRLES